MSTGRKEKSIRNIKYAIIGQISCISISFLTRIVFVRILSSEYLGLNGLFSNILTILSIADLGIGEAIVFSLYKPLAEKDETKINALMNLYQKSYRAIGCIVGILGVVLAPFLQYIIKDMPNIPHIRLIYLMFVANSALSYFFSYKRSLLIADQKRYIATFYRYSFYFLLNLMQIGILITTKNYLMYLALQIVFTLLENILVSRKADEVYGFIKKNNKVALAKEEKDTIIRNVKAMIYHKVGGITVNGTDNIVLSKLIGINTVGIYSNYLLVINALNICVGLIFDSLIASIGNFGVTKGSENSKTVFQTINFMSFWICGFISISLYNLFNPFIEIWIGQGYVFSTSIVLAIVLNFYISAMRNPVLAFRNAFGLYWQDRYKPVFESVINIIASVVLTMKLGTIGVFIGTFISTIFTCFWVEPYILFKYGFKDSVRSYFVNYSIYTTAVALVGIFTYCICELFGSGGVLVFIQKLLACIIIPNCLFMLMFLHRKEYKDLFDIGLSVIHKEHM